MHELDEVRGGFETECDVVVVGSGAGGAVAAANLARAGARVVVVEAGPKVRPEEMSRDAPRFLARHFWEGGLRMIGGSGQFPTLQGRCVGGSTVINSAILMAPPDWVLAAWRRETGLDLFTSDALAASYARIFERLRVAPTPLAVLGRRSLVARDALARMGLPGAPLPRAVVECEGCGDCLTGCSRGHKQSVDRNYLLDAEADGARIFTHSVVDRVLHRDGAALGVSGQVVDPRGWRKLGRFTVRAPRVVLAAGTLHTPILLWQSGLRAGGTVGSTLSVHIGGAAVGIMDEPTEPWAGATQGWSALSAEFPGMKYECLWASPSVLMVTWGDVGAPFIERLHEIRHAAVIAMVYRAPVHGQVRPRRDGTPAARLHIPDTSAREVFRGLRVAARGLLEVGARYVGTGVPGTVAEMRTPTDTDSLLDERLGARHLRMSVTHLFGACRMTAHPDEGACDANGRVRGTSGVYVADASLFPSPSAVNPQATVMALADLVSRRLVERAM